VTPAVRHRARGWASMPALASAGIVVAAVALGAAHDGGVRTASAHVSAQGGSVRGESWPRRAPVLPI
jgi:hypothetical protein